MIRYNNNSRPVDDSNDPPATLPATPCPKSGARDPQPPGLTSLDSNGKEAFSRRKDLPRGGFRRMKMPQEKNGENTDLNCDLVLCRNKDYEKKDITRLEAFEMKVWRRVEKISWTEHISNEVLELVEEERSLLTIIYRTRQRNWMGHIMTEDSVQREIIEGRMDCK